LLSRSLARARARAVAFSPFFFIYFSFIFHLFFISLTSFLESPLFRFFPSRTREPRFPLGMSGSSFPRAIPTLREEGAREGNERGREKERERERTGRSEEWGLTSFFVSLPPPPPPPSFFLVSRSAPPHFHFSSCFQTCSPGSTRRIHRLTYDTTTTKNSTPKHHLIEREGGREAGRGPPLLQSSPIFHFHFPLLHFDHLHHHLFQRDGEKESARHLGLQQRNGHDREGEGGGWALGRREREERVLSSSSSSSPLPSLLALSPPRRHQGRGL